MPLCARLSPLWLPSCLKDEAFCAAAKHWRGLCPYPKPKALRLCLFACSLCRSWCLSHARQTLPLSYTLRLRWWRRGEIIGSQAAGPASVPCGQSVEPRVYRGGPRCECWPLAYCSRASGEMSGGEQSARAPPFLFLPPYSPTGVGNARQETLVAQRWVWWGGGGGGRTLVLGFFAVCFFCGHRLSSIPEILWEGDQFSLHCGLSLHGTESQNTSPGEMRARTDSLCPCL